MSIYYLVGDEGEIIFETGNKEAAVALGDTIIEFTTVVSEEEYMEVYRWHTESICVLTIGMMITKPGFVA